MARELLFVTCTPGRKEECALYHSLAKLGRHRSFFFENTPSRVPLHFNRVLNDPAIRDLIVVFAHENLAVSDIFVEEKLNEAVTTHGFTVVGVAGSSSFNLRFDPVPTLWSDGPPEALSGAYELIGPGVTTTWRSFGSTPRRCVTLDGSLLAVDPAKLGGIRFDEQFESHFYDLDFCLAVNAQGLTLGTTNAYVLRKPPVLPAAPLYQMAQNRFRAKWGARLRKQ